MKHLRDFLVALGVFATLAFATGDVFADKVKYCKNYTTGQIITVEARMPCPFPTSKI